MKRHSQHGFVVGNLRKLRGSSRKLRGRRSVLIQGNWPMSSFRNVKFQYAKILAKRSDNTQISLHNRLTILLNQTLQLPLLFCVVFWKWDLTMWQVILKNGCDKGQQLQRKSSIHIWIQNQHIFYSHMLRGSSCSVRGSDIAKNRTIMAPRKLAEANF